MLQVIHGHLYLAQLNLTSCCKCRDNTSHIVVASGSITEEFANNYFTETNEVSGRQLELDDQRGYVDEAIQRLPKLEGLLITLNYLEDADTQC